MLHGLGDERGVGPGRFNNGAICSNAATRWTASSAPARHAAALHTKDDVLACGYDRGRRIGTLRATEIDKRSSMWICPAVIVSSLDDGDEVRASRSTMCAARS